MKYLLVLLFSGICSIASSQVLVGYIKNSGSFFPGTDAIGLTSVNTAAYISGGKFGQVGIGAVITNVSGTPINGGSTWWGYSATSGGTSLYRGYKIDGSGVVIGFVAQTSGPNKMIPIAYHNNSGASSCGAGGSYTNPIYGAVDDPGIYPNKPVFSSDGGGSFTNGTLFTASFLSGGSSYWTFTYSSSDSKATSVVCCSTNPLSYAGPDAIYDMLTSTIYLTGTGIDCDGTWTYSWSRISGPNTPTLNNSTSATANITGFVAGTYVYRLSVTDNASHTTTDDVTITVYPVPLTTNPKKILVDTLMVYGLEGEDGRGTDNSGYFFDEDVDPRAGIYDFNSTTAGFQKQQTSGRIVRLNHDWHRSGLGRQILIEWDTVKYITKLYIYDTTGEAGHTVKFYIGNTTKLQKARWPWVYGSQSADYTYTTKSTAGWDSLTLSGQDSGSKVIMESDNFAVDITAVFYGANSTYNTLDTGITRKPGVSLADTSLTLYQLHRINNDGALPLNNSNYPNDSLPGYSWERFYYAPVKTGNSLAQVLGMFDPDSTAWVAGGLLANTNQIDVGPFCNCSDASNPYLVDSIVHLHKGILMNVRGVNGFYTGQTGRYNPEDYSKNDKDANPRTRFAWDRDASAKKAIIAKFFQTTSPTNPSQYRYKHDRWPGRFGLNFFEPIFEVDNEKDEGFRSDSAYMSPEMIGLHGSVVYDTCKALQPSLTMLTQAYVTGNSRVLRAAIKNMQLFYGSRKKWFDGVSMHGNVFEEEYRHSPTSEDLRFQHGALPGRHGARNQALADIKMISQELGFYSPFYYTEVAYTEDSIGPTAADYSDAFYSLCGAVPIKNYHADTSAAINNYHYFMHLAIPQVKGIWKYTTMDAVGPSSIYRFNSDARDGIADYTAVGTGGGRILHPLYYYEQSLVLRFPDWEWADSVANFIDGYFIDKWWKKTNHDSIFYSVIYQSRYNDAPVNYTLPVGNTSTVTHLRPSFGSFTMQNMGTQSIVSHNILPTGRPEGDIYVFYDPNLPPTANAGSDQGIVLPINSVIVDGSFSSDPDGSISTYAWSKISGPSTYTIVSPSSATTVINNLVQGTYVFRLTVTDNRGATATDDVTITVAQALPGGPTIFLGRKVITN